MPRLAGRSSPSPCRSPRLQWIGTLSCAANTPCCAARCQQACSSPKFRAVGSSLGRQVGTASPRRGQAATEHADGECPHTPKCPVCTRVPSCWRLAAQHGVSAAQDSVPNHRKRGDRHGLGELRGEASRSECLCTHTNIFKIELIFGVWNRLPRADSIRFIRFIRFIRAADESCFRSMQVLEYFFLKKRKRSACM